MKPEVAQAIKEIEVAFPDAKVDVVKNEGDGYDIKIQDVPLAEIYQQKTTWIGFSIAEAGYPYADIHPHFVREDLSRVDGKPLGDEMPLCTFLNCPAIRLSRLTRRTPNPINETALIKLWKVLRWLNNRP